MATTAADLGTTPPPTDRRRWLGLAALSAGVTMVMIDATIINVSLPAITAELDLVPTDLQWINSIYSLVFAALLITMGRTGDALGRRKVFLSGALLFVAASIIAATASSGEAIIAGRAIQGIGGAMMIPASLSLLNTMFRGKDRAIAFAVWGATVGTVAAIGPLLGGFLTTEFSWRWSFFINVPIAAISVIGVLLLIRESKDDHAVPGIDLAGVVLSAVGLGALVFALIEGQNFGWWAPRGDVTLGPITWPLENLSPVPIAFALSVVSLVLFVVVEKRRAASGRSVVLDLTLFRIRSFAWGNAVGMCIMFGEFGMLLTLPLFLQNVLGYTALRAGVTTAAIMVGALLAAPSSGRLTQKKGPVFVVRIGLIAEAIAMVGIAFTYRPDAEQWMFVPWLLLFGVGVGLGTAQLINVVLRDVPVAQSGQASGTQSTSRQVGTALGVAVLGAVLWTSFGGLLPTQLEDTASMDAATAQQVSDDIVQSSGVTINSVDVPPEALVESRYGSEAGLAAAEAFSTATSYATLVGAGFVMIGIAATVAGFRRRENDDGTAPEPVVAASASATA